MTDLSNDELKSFSDAYVSLLTTELEGINLTRIIDRDEFYLKQVLDSIVPMATIPILYELITSNLPLIDIGFGGGFPVLPLAKFFPNKQFYGIETRGKKVKAVEFISKRLSIVNAKLFKYRYEELFFDKDAILTFKSFGDINTILSKICTDSHLRVVFYKGPHLSNKEDLQSVNSNWKLLEKFNIKIDNRLERTIVLFETSKVPRGTLKKTNKKLVKFSELL